MERTPKPMRVSRTVTTLILLPHQANAAGNAHGGEILKIMDNTAGIAAMRHSEGNVVTARVDEVMFIHPIHIGDIITCRADVAYTGRSSMQVYTTVEILHHGRAAQQALSAFFTLVALDENQLPRPVHPVIAEAEWEIGLSEEGKRRYLAQKK